MPFTEEDDGDLISFSLGTAEDSGHITWSSLNEDSCDIDRNGEKTLGHKMLELEYFHTGAGAEGDEAKHRWAA